VEIRRELGPSEKLLWAGRPRQGLALQPADAFLIPFSLMWGGFAIFWETMVLVGRAPFFFALWGIPFVLVGLYMIAGRFWVDAWQRRATVYGITSERVLIVSGLWSRTVRSLRLETLGDVSFTERARGGTISFASFPTPFPMHGRSPWPFGGGLVPSFQLDEGARKVHEILQKAQREARQAR
jgi:hypothetical protein